MIWRSIRFFILLLLLASCEKPDFYDSQGRGYLYRDLAGKWQLVNYWATWCAPCIREIPEFNQLARDYSDSVNVFGVNFDVVDAPTMAEHIAKMGIEFPVYAEDPFGELGFDRPVVLPTTIVISPQGSVQEILVGPQTRETLLAAMGLES